MQKYRILIVGAGIAGGAAGALLGRSGHDVTLVERSAGVRSSGSPVDIRGGALGVVRALGLEAAARERDTGAHALALLKRDGRAFTTIGMRAGPADIEIARVDLAAILAGAAREVADLRFDDTFEALNQDAGGVDVRFVSGAQVRYDLVIGADGQNSATRRRLWGADAADRRAPGLAIATAPLPLSIDDPRIVEMYNEPGLSLTVHPAGGRPGAAFIFRTDASPADRGAQVALLRDLYASMGWRAAEFLAALDDVPDLYFDRVRRVAARSWARGRVGLLGDAASSLTILGEGSSMALLGARQLDQSLRDAPDAPAALAAYEARHRPVVERAQSGAALGAAFLVPAGAVGLGIRNLVARAIRRV
ncbi:FAD-dependent monooxygenase [Microbacterium jejuense]|uniref:FAD-dependent monooxygenase n=1 Tax=Microbacterium jejuense TaxID=1263637 RepID=A0ABS7HJC4_9MICO|nr:FAD-dependent monooxygenase [Microbacterium jejuense]MBW9092381.1 FAD-dependent monooxygenase [Microbacterium jejuense]